MDNPPPESKSATPRLAFLSGPLQGTVRPVEGDHLFLGRAEGSDLCIPSMAVSRKHCTIERRDGRFRLTDLDSSNGTFVNGIPVNDHWLEHGDQIRIGDTLALFLLHADAETPLSPSVALDDEDLASRSTVELPPDRALYLGAEPDPRTALEARRLLRHLTALVEFSRTVASATGVEAVVRQLLEAALHVVPAGRGAVLLAEHGGSDFRLALGIHRKGGKERPVHVSRTIVRRVLAENRGLLCSDVEGNPDLGEIRSLAATRTASLLAVPLATRRRALGVLYLASADRRDRLDECHLELATALGCIAAIAVENAERLEGMIGENRRLAIETCVPQEIVGGSAAIRRVHAFIARVAPTDSPVLICGESGTGKELVARALHRGSPRAGRPFVAINCAALAESLLESELFGHERGAFTGAIARKKGRIEVADGGTLFLDEIAELAPPLQAKLLRALQEHEFERVGGTSPIKVDVRVLAASNKDLREAARRGAFREDLLYRINVVAITLPPLREHREDLPLLANYFADQAGIKARRRGVTISEAAMRCLSAYAWPGNVRELRNAIEHAVVVGSAPEILPEDLPENILETAPAAATPLAHYHGHLREEKRRLILEAFRQAGGSHARAAEALGVHPNYLHRLVRNLDLKGEIKG